MNYEDALKEWGAIRLQQSYYGTKGIEIDRKSVVVEMNFNPGYDCCGGKDPDCYCSFAESPSANVIIKGFGIRPKRNFSITIDADEFNFINILSEIVNAAGGTVTDRGNH